jgi:hypothetical protein
MKSTFTKFTKLSALFITLAFLSVSIAHADQGPVPEPAPEQPDEDDNEHILVCILFPICEGPSS